MTRISLMSAEPLRGPAVSVRARVLPAAAGEYDEVMDQQRMAVTVRRKSGDDEEYDDDDDDLDDVPPSGNGHAPGNPVSERVCERTSSR